MGIDLKYKIEHKLKTAQEFEARGENLHAIQVYYSIIKNDPDYVEAYFLLAELFEKQGNLKSAKNLLWDYFEENPENNLFRLYYAQFFLRNSMWESVIDILHSMDIKEEPLAAFFLGYSFFMLNDFESAKINFLHFVSSGKKTELLNETFIYLAKTEIQLKNFEKALEYARKSEIVYNNFWELHLLFAIVYYNLGMFTHSVSSIIKSLRLNADEASVYEWAGKIFLKTGDYLKAEKNFLKHIEMVENPNSEIYSELGEACLKTKKTKDALQYYELALKINPLNNSAKEGKKNASFILQTSVNDA